MCCTSVFKYACDEERLSTHELFSRRNCMAALATTWRHCLYVAWWCPRYIFSQICSLFVALNRMKCNVRVAEVIITSHEPIKYIAFSAIRLPTMNWLLSYVNILPSIYAVSSILYFGYGQHSGIKMM